MVRPMRIASVARALPGHVATQAEIQAKLEELWSDRRAVLARLPSLLENTRVERRHLVQPLEEYSAGMTFGEANDRWIRFARELGERAVRGALERLGLEPRDVDLILVVSITGISSPSLDAMLAGRMGFRPDVKRVPIFGLGCVAGAAGIARAADYVRAYPDQVALLLSVELCSLTFQREDTSVANLISTGLFGDGAAAAVILGEERARRQGVAGMRILDTRSVLYPDTEGLMGWRVSERGFGIVLSPEVPSIARERIAPDVDAFLAEHGMSREDVVSWVCHPGGPKVLAALCEGLALTEHEVRHVWRSLAQQGNLSSTSVLLVLEDVLAEGPPEHGGRGMILAMGPGFCAEMVLFEWCG